MVFFLPQTRLFLTEGELLHNIAWASGIRPPESATGIHVSLPLQPPHHLPPLPPLQVVTEPGFEFPHVCFEMSKNSLVSARHQLISSPEGRAGNLPTGLQTTPPGLPRRCLVTSPALFPFPWILLPRGVGNSEDSHGTPLFGSPAHTISSCFPGSEIAQGA